MRIFALTIDLRTNDGRRDPLPEHVPALLLRACTCREHAQRGTVADAARIPRRRCARPPGREDGLECGERGRRHARPHGIVDGDDGAAELEREDLVGKNAVSNGLWKGGKME